MKFKLIALALLLSGLNAFSQTRNNISVYWATVKSDMLTYGTIGDFGYDSRGGSTKFGINYERQLSASWTLQTGLQYTDVPMLLTSISPPVSRQTLLDYKFITLPVLAKVTFWKVFFLDGGVLLNVETNSPGDTLPDKQTGIGFELGTGLQYDFNHFRVFVNPYLQVNSLVSFQTTQSHFSLVSSGWKFGLGYNF